jgi:hypothetical protein
MLKLPQVTLVAFTGLDIEGHKKAIEYSCREIEFGAVKLIVEHSNSIDEWNRKIIYELPKHIDTKFCLLIHADGYIIHPESWREEWLSYDYIGAPWPLPRDSFSYRDINGVVQRVGNSVSLRSKRLLDFANTASLEWKAFHGFTNEDGFICINYRHEYEKAGMKFAPFEVAKYFSKEHEIPENVGIKTFMFHKYGRGNIS